MTQESIVRDQETTATATADTAILAQIVETVRRDSQEETARYLEESTVPHGGE